LNKNISRQTKEVPANEDPLVGELPVKIGQFKVEIFYL